MDTKIADISAGAYTEWNVHVQIEPGSVPDCRNRYGEGIRPDGLHILVRRYPAVSLPSFPGAVLGEAEPDQAEVTIRGPRLKKDGTPGKMAGREWFYRRELKDLLSELPEWAAGIVRSVLRDIRAAAARADRP
jgi:hypothetical protein